MGEVTRVNGDITIRPKDIFKFGHKKKTGNSLLTQIVQSLGCPRLGRLTVLDTKLPGAQDVWPPHTHLLHCPLYTRSRNKGPPLFLEQADLGAARASDLRSRRLQQPPCFRGSLLHLWRASAPPSLTTSDPHCPPLLPFRFLCPPHTSVTYL